jgi:hypothetical protein
VYWVPQHQRRPDLLRILDDIVLLRPGDDPDLLRATHAHTLDQEIDHRPAVYTQHLLRAVERLEANRVARCRDDANDPHQACTSGT